MYSRYNQFDIKINAPSEMFTYKEDRTFLSQGKFVSEYVYLDNIDHHSFIKNTSKSYNATDYMFVQKTGKVIVAHEDSLSFGYGAEIAARIADELFEFLDAPVRRVAATDTFVAYAPQLEDIILPQVADVAKTISELHSY